MPRTLFVLLCTAILCTHAAAEPVPDYGFQWSTIGAPGNRATTPEEVPIFTPLAGAVDYEYRMTTTKLSVAQHTEFVNAYAPYWTQSPSDPGLTGRFIRAYYNDQGNIAYRPLPGFDNYAADLGWEMAARYCNWLHNGKQMNQAAFETGVYDLAAFDPASPNLATLIRPAPGARFWIPNLDEWVKAVYYDPNRHGPGQEGYWSYCNSSDSPLIPGLPQNGGETIGELPWLEDHLRPYGAWDLGQFPNTQTPWGLLDVSGTMSDLISYLPNPLREQIILGGSMAGTPFYGEFDMIGSHQPSWVGSGTLCGLRIASVVPSPSTALALAAGCIFATRRVR